MSQPAFQFGLKAGKKPNPFRKPSTPSTPAVVAEGVMQPPLASTSGKLSFALGRKKVANPLAGQERDSDEETETHPTNASTISQIASIDSFAATSSTMSSDTSHPTPSGGVHPPSNTLSSVESDRERNRQASKSEQQRVNAQLQAMQKKSILVADKAHQLALEEDPTVFDYDAAYDHLKEANLIKQRQCDGGLDGAARKKPRYIQGLLSASAKRKIELERAEERKIQREREQEGDQFGQTDMFVTDAYLKRKEELRQIEEEEKRKEDMDAKNRDMTGFYRDILDKREAQAASIAALAEASAQQANHNRLLATESHNPRRSLLDEERRVEMQEQELKQQRLQSGDIVVNDSEEIVDKRQLLSGGLNLTAKALRQQALEQQEVLDRELKAQQEKAAEKAEMLEKALRARRSREQGLRAAQNSLEQQRLKKLELEVQIQNEQEQLAEVAASKVSTTQVASARERYLARKKASEAP
ncbi:hypothetical protein BASA50_001963 [Batrachochytrium salamandrivorans]|uniref:Nuclear speckle splicing regulatory protein 1 N-terminal domain-containing protein n=1 Tax=Batrachochytrium salamandrivorans TaxID=1357716 RepID=A0ABQ8FMR4_9FUNG|nr:hypothetical protein BASA60_007280 [Batrachochytrium salamandrivorans]KAH6600958.1 hypothetical protein BASA50_001963 [Batrachochytrium salamandrivorans]